MFSFTINNLNENIHKMHYLKDLFEPRQLSILVQFGPFDPIQFIWFTLVFQSTLIQFNLLQSTQSVLIHFGLIGPYTDSFCMFPFQFWAPKFFFFIWVEKYEILTYLSQNFLFCAKKKKKNTNKMDTRNYRYGLTKAINMINIQQITIKFKLQ